MEGSCEYIEYAVADSRQWVVLQLGGRAAANNPSLKLSVCYETLHTASGGLLWMRWWTFRFLRHGVSNPDSYVKKKAL
jgi:hypothetical protein